ncbi:MAG: phosphatase PAP2 family protein [Candidatus Limnocylindria bacterium]
MKLLAAGGIALVVVLAVAVGTGLAALVDRPIIDAIRAPELAGLLAPLRQLTELGSTGAVIAVAGLVFAVGAAIGPWRHGLIGALSIGLASIGNTVLKETIDRVRPEVLEPIVVEHGFSFPSGHALLGTVAWGVLGVLIWRSRLRAGWRRAIVAALAILVILIGLSRIWLGVHFPTDVLAGWILGALIVLLYARVTREVSKEPAAGAADADPTAPRSGPPAPG